VRLKSDGVNIKDGELPIAIVPNRLAAPFDLDIRPALGSPAVVRSGEVSSAWQQFSVRAHLYELGAATNRIERDRVGEFVGLTASVGEQFALARSALLECEAWRSRRLLSNAAGDEMCHRALAELLSHYCIAIAHSFVNLTARLLSIDPRLHGALTASFKNWTLQPYSDRRNDWLSANRKTVDSLSTIAKTAPLSEMADAVVPIARVVMSTAWTQLDERRGTDFHRRRPQSAGVLGAPMHSSWTQTAPHVWRVDSASIYRDGNQLAEITMSAGTAVLLALAEAAAAFSTVRGRVLGLLLNGQTNAMRIAAASE
jgi:hypothetical protein